MLGIPQQLPHIGRMHSEAHGTSDLSHVVIAHIRD